MARRMILLVLTAIAVGLLVFGSILTSQQTYKIWGFIEKSHGEDDGTMTVYFGPGDFAPVNAPWYSSGVWKYDLDGLEPNPYWLYAVYEDSLEICKSDTQRVTIVNEDVRWDFSIESEDCIDKE